MDVIAQARRTGALVVALVVALAACAREGAPAADSTIVANAARSPIAIGGGGRPSCPGTGHWSPCTVLTRLEAAGVAPQKAASLPNLPSLDAAPALYTVGRSGLAVYLFADSAARSRAARMLDTTKFVSAVRELTMRGETTAIQSDNLLALLFSRNEQQRERVSDALTAGPPQPGKP